MTRSDSYYPTSLEPWQKLVGGLPRGTLTALVGPPQAGKTTLGLQLCVEACATQEKSLLVFDTENAWHVYQGLCEAFSKRFGVEVNLVRLTPHVTKKKDRDGDPEYGIEWVNQKGETKKGTLNVVVVYCPDIVPISVAWGRGYEVDVSPKSGKIRISYLSGAFSKTIEESPIGKLCVEHDVGAVLIDSITTPFDEVITNQENLPARSDATQVWLAQVNKLATVLDLPIVTVVHESRNPASTFGQDLGMEGGKAVEYFHKQQVYVMDRNLPGLLPKQAGKPSKLPHTGRRLFNMRIPGTASWTRNVAVEITDEGIVAFDAAQASDSAEE